MAAFGLYSHIQSNKRRSVILLIGLFMLVYVLVFAGALFIEAWTHNAPLNQLLRAARFDLFKAAPFATIGAVVWIIIAYKFHQSMIDAITGGHEVTRQEEPKLYNLLENLCISRGLPMPTLRIVDDDALNAFTTGMNPKQYSISVTRGLLAALNDDEMEAVLAHELTHIQNGDVRMLVIAVVIAGVVSFFGEMVFRIFFQNAFYWGGGRSRSSSNSDGDRKGGGAVIAIVIAVALIVVAWVLAIVIRFALSRSREYLADAGSVELTKNPDAMISALRKIEGRGELKAANSAVMEMCIDNPRNEFMDLFATHPSVEARVKALVETAGGHDPGPLQIEPPPLPDAGPGQIGEDPNAPAGPWGPSLGANVGPNIGQGGEAAPQASGPTAPPLPGAPGYDPFPPLPSPPPSPGSWPWGRKP